MRRIKAVNFREKNDDMKSEFVKLIEVKNEYDFFFLEKFEEEFDAFFVNCFMKQYLIFVYLIKYNYINIFFLCFLYWR